MNLFYAPPEQRAGDLIAIGGDEARHISKVLRHKVGDELMVTDGRGSRFTTRISSITKRDLYCKIYHQEFITREPDRILVIGLLHKRQRLEWALEKATELGVSKFILYQAVHSERSVVKEERSEHLAISAMKQSGRVYLPEMLVANSMEKALQVTQNTVRIVAHEKAESNPQTEHDREPSEPLSFWVGPEGGFADQEIQMLLEQKAVLYRLGTYRLRSETAAIAILSRFLS